MKEATTILTRAGLTWSPEPLLRNANGMLMKRMLRARIFEFPTA